MKFLVKIISFFIFIFILNIVFYYISSDYKIFLESLKYTENIKDSSEFVYKNIDNKEDNIIKKEIEKLNNNILKKENEKKDKKIGINKLIVNKEVILGKNYRNILNKFVKNYDLNKIEVNTVLFEITDDFPDDYYEYYSPDLTIYFFTTKTYLEILDFFHYLERNGPFNIKEMNNFGEKSFYINLNKEINDNFIRLVITQNGITYGLKIKNDEYENVKNLLLNNFNN